MTTPAVDWSTFYADLHAFVSARVRGAADADDVVQLVIERALLKAPNAEIENVAAWLFGVARNAVTDYYREQARRSLAIAEELEQQEALFESAEGERAAVLACMEPLLATLDAADAQLLRWADMEGRTMQAIADALGISLTATKSRVQRARKEFVRTTQACCAIDQDPRGRVIRFTPRANPGGSSVNQEPLSERVPSVGCDCSTSASKASKGSS